MSARVPVPPDCAQVKTGGLAQAPSWNVRVIVGLIVWPVPVDVIVTANPSSVPITVSEAVEPIRRQSQSARR